jgi:hypothetical protein
MAKLSPFQRRALAQIADPEASSEAPPLILLGTIKALMVRGLIKHEPGPSHDRLVATPTGRAALTEDLQNVEA